MTILSFSNDLIWSICSCLNIDNSAVGSEDHFHTFFSQDLDVMVE
ncbi:hypothetical protein J2X97_001693 [Epilithonimonas hungarica]|nr:hypothetical protein [Epilithonimonas hungarica]MDP9956056.1 hypothetical protein [Epilithonimonas hungarica]